MKISELNCKNCDFYEKDYGMMGFDDTEDCRAFSTKQLNLEQLSPDIFWCHKHSKLKEIIEPKKSSSEIKAGFYKKPVKKYIPEQFI